MISSGHRLKGVPAAFLADFCAFWFAFAEVADDDLLFGWMHVGNSARTGFDALSAASAFCIVYKDGVGLSVSGQCLEWACVDAGIVVALCA